MLELLHALGFWTNFFCPCQAGFPTWVSALDLVDLPTAPTKIGWRMALRQWIRHCHSQHVLVILCGVWKWMPYRHCKKNCMGWWECAAEETASVFWNLQTAGGCEVYHNIGGGVGDHHRSGTKVKTGWEKWGPATLYAGFGWVLGWYLQYSY